MNQLYFSQTVAYCIHAYVFIVSWIHVCVYICIPYIYSKILTETGITVLILVIVNDLGCHLCAIIVIVRKNAILK